MDNFAIALEDGLAHDLAAIDIADVVTNHSPLTGGCLFGRAREANLDDTTDAVAEGGRSHGVGDFSELEHIGYMVIIPHFHMNVHKKVKKSEYFLGGPSLIFLIFLLDRDLSQLWDAQDHSLRFLCDKIKELIQEDSRIILGDSMTCKCFCKATTASSRIKICI